MEQRSILIADLGYGDAGKGSMVDYLCRSANAHTVVRYNGGAQAAHCVVTPDGRRHIFAQFGSGTFLPGVRTVLSRYMLVHPLAMLAEERHLCSLGIHDAFERTFVDREALIITPFQQSANRLKELARGAGRHGSCGLGIGETMSDWLAFGAGALFAGDLEDRPTVIRKLRQIREAKLAQLAPLFDAAAQEAAFIEERKLLEDPAMVEMTADLYQYFAGRVNRVDREALQGFLEQPGVTLFEGAQGVLLDEWWGFYPYNSWSTLTFQNADTLLAEANYSGRVERLGLIRGYATRHGAGPFVTEDARLTQDLPDDSNGENPWQRKFRVGFLDLVALRYAMKVVGRVDGLVVTNLDRMEAIPEWRLCNAYQAPRIAPSHACFFDGKGIRITDLIVPSDPTNLEAMEARTRLLMEMQPVYTTYPRCIETYLDAISQALQVPIAITSAGPTAQDKRMWPASA